MTGEVVLVGPRSGATYRTLSAAWAEALERFEREIFPTSDPDELCQAAEYAAMARDFPEGGFVAFDGDDIVAVGVGIRRHLDLTDPLHRLTDVQRPGGGSGHQADGPWYYGTTIAVLASHRGRGIGDELYGLRKAVCRRLGLAGIVAGGVIPGFAEHKHAMTVNQYLDAVRTGDLIDPTLTFQLSRGFEIVAALPGYIDNPDVDDYAALIVWHNPDRLRPAVALDGR